ncbi:unnamed protein product [Prunus armeniaca]
MKDKELNSFATTLHERNDAYLFLEREFANVTHSYDKLLAKFDVCCEAVEESKSEAVVDTYKLGYLDCKEGVALFEEQVVDKGATDELVGEGGNIKEGGAAELVVVADLGEITEQVLWLNIQPPRV